MTNEVYDSAVVSGIDVYKRSLPSVLATLPAGCVGFVRSADGPEHARRALSAFPNVTAKDCAILPSAAVSVATAKKTLDAVGVRGDPIILFDRLDALAPDPFFLAACQTQMRIVATVTDPDQMSEAVRLFTVYNLGSK